MFYYPELSLLAYRCYDLHSSCSEWASAGECMNNPGYMIGRGKLIGSFILSTTNMIVTFLSACFSGGLNGNCLASCMNKVEPGKIKIKCSDIQYYSPGIENQVTARS